MAFFLIVPSVMIVSILLVHALANRLGLRIYYTTLIAVAVVSIMIDCASAATAAVGREYLLRLGLMILASSFLLTLANRFLLKRQQAEETRFSEEVKAAYEASKDEDFQVIEKSAPLNRDDSENVFDLPPAYNAKTDKADAEKISADKADVEKISADKVDDKKTSSDKADAGKISADKADAEKISADKADAEKVSADKVDAEKISSDKADAEKISSVKVDAEKVSADKADAGKISSVKVDVEKISSDKVDAKKISSDKAAAEKISSVKADAEKVSSDKADAKKISSDKVDAEKVSSDKADAKKISSDKVDAKKISSDKAAAEKISSDKADAEKISSNKADAKKVSANKVEDTLEGKNTLPEKFPLEKVFKPLSEVKPKEADKPIKLEEKPKPKDEFPLEEVFKPLSDAKPPQVKHFETPKKIKRTELFPLQEVFRPLSTLDLDKLEEITQEEKALPHEEETNPEEKIATLDDLLDKAYEERDKGHVWQAIETYKKALERYRNDEYAPFVAIDLGNIYKEQALYSKAIKIYEEALTLPAIKRNVATRKEFLTTLEYLRVVHNVLIKHKALSTPFSQLSKEILQEIDTEFKRVQINSAQ